MKNKPRDAAYRKYKQMKKRDESEKAKKARAKARMSLDHNPLEGGPLSESKDPLADVKNKR